MLPEQLLSLDTSTLSPQQLAEAWQQSVSDALQQHQQQEDLSPAKSVHSNSKSRASDAAAAAAGDDAVAPAKKADSAGGGAASKSKRKGSSSSSGDDKTKAKKKSNKAKDSKEGEGEDKHAKDSKVTAKEAKSKVKREATPQEVALSSFIEAAWALFQEFRPDAPLSLPKVLALCRLIGEIMVGAWLGPRYNCCWTCIDLGCIRHMWCCVWRLQHALKPEEHFQCYRQPSELCQTDVSLQVKLAAVVLVGTQMTSACLLLALSAACQIMHSV